MGRDEPEFGGFEDQALPSKPSYYKRIAHFIVSKIMEFIRGNEYLSALFLEDPKPEYVDYMGRRDYESYERLKRSADEWERTKLEKGEELILVDIHIADTGGTDTARLVTTKGSRWVRIGR